MHQRELIAIGLLLVVHAGASGHAQQAAPMTFFITSVGSGQGGSLGGLAGADKHCQTLAAAVGAGSRTWRAYLSTQAADGQPAVNARDRIGKGPWFNAKGGKVADSLAHLHGDTLELARVGNSISKYTGLNEKGEEMKGYPAVPLEHDMLTGSQPDGTAFPPGMDRTCRNWTSANEGMAQVGHFDRTAAGSISWNSAHTTKGCSQDGLRATGGAGLFYCFAADLGAQQTAGTTQHFEPDVLKRMSVERTNLELQVVVRPFKVFDNLYFVGNGGVSSWLITTTDGLVLLDAAQEPFVTHTLDRIRQLGFEPRQIKYLLVSHGHADHGAGAALLQEQFKTRVVTVAEDWDMLLAPPSGPAAFRPPKRDMVVKDGDTLKVGDTTFKFYKHPGHTPGGLSIEFTVFDNGRPYKAFSMSGSANGPGVGLPLAQMMLESAKRVQQMSGIEVNVQNHPFLMGHVFEKAERLARRVPGEPHPFVEPEAFRKWSADNVTSAEQRLAEAKNAAAK